MRIMVKYIGLISAFKVGCLMSLLPLLCVAIAFVFYPVVISNGRTSINLTGALVLPMLAFGLIGAFLSGIGATIHALLYNIVAAIFGGLEINLIHRDRYVEIPTESDPQMPVISRYGDYLQSTDQPKPITHPRAIHRGEKR